MGILHGKQPTRVWKYFEELCAIPHGSGNTKRISDYCVAFAKAHNLRYTQDAMQNVIIWKDASNGYESHPPVIVQGHLDMVCEKEPDSDFDFEADGLRLQTQGETEIGFSPKKRRWARTTASLSLWRWRFWRTRSLPTRRWKWCSP